eukprot:TRINITY_DN14063_c0_g1_i1.p1 TRINITY_DN14063_c0_g1~~TRINITY_DN14063_c0_g1_i1.p1  ORF type:complete len:248 (-),score=16.31 TRINITY_DN14063_c0_g1_i1:110-853(-)
MQKRQKKRPRRQVKRACNNCRRSHTKCENKRPCSRCTHLKMADSCADRPLKATGKKRKASESTCSDYGEHLHDNKRMKLSDIQSPLEQDSHPGSSSTRGSVTINNGDFPRYQQNHKHKEASDLSVSPGSSANISAISAISENIDAPKTTNAMINSMVRDVEDDSSRAYYNLASSSSIPQHSAPYSGNLWLAAYETLSNQAIVEKKLRKSDLDFNPIELLGPPNIYPPGKSEMQRRREQFLQAFVTYC